MDANQEKQWPNQQQLGKPFKCDTCGKPHKTESCWNGANAANDPRPKRHTTQEQKRDTPAQMTTTDFDTEPKN